MKDLTIQQKSAAFDALVEWLESESESERKLSDENWAENRNILASWNNGKADAYNRAVEMALQIAAQRATTEQAENMPPAGLDLSKHVGQTAVLWDGRQGKIELSTALSDDPYAFRLYDGTRYLYLTANGFYWEEMTADTWNIKTILP